MTENDRVFDAFKSCITEPKCKDCPWTECDKLKNRRVEIPIDLALAVMRLLKAQEQKCRKCAEATSEAIQELQTKLKAQEPVKPVFDAGDGKTIGQFLCGKCHAKIGLGHPHFCWYCGRAVKWE